MAKKKKIESPEVPEQVYIYHGENIQELALQITGSASKVFAMLAYSGLSLSHLKDGDVIRWRI